MLKNDFDFFSKIKTKEFVALFLTQNMNRADDFRTLELINNNFGVKTLLPAMSLKKQKEASTQKENPFMITTASCGTVTTRFVTARNAIDVKRALLVNCWSPNNSYFYEKLGLKEKEKVLAILIGIQAEKSFFDLTPADIGALDNLRGFSDEQVIAILPDESIEVLFTFAFTGGEGEQEGNPGKEWQTITVEPLCPTFVSIYKEFNAANVITEDLKEKAKACDFLYNEDRSTQRVPISLESKFVDIAAAGSGDMASSRYSQKGIVIESLEPTEQISAKPAAVKKLTWKPSYTLAADQIRSAAESLIEKHKAYLMIFLGSYPPPIDSQTISLTAEMCQKSFAIALEQGLEYHFKNCGTNSHDGVTLGCNANTESGCRIWPVQQAWTSKQLLTNNEATVLSDLIRLDNKTIRELDSEEEYTANTIVRLLF
jgi:rubredoxin